jgi:hypothetical protein
VPGDSLFFRRDPKYRINNHELKGVPFYRGKMNATRSGYRFAPELASERPFIKCWGNYSAGKALILGCLRPVFIRKVCKKCPNVIRNQNGVTDLLNLLALSFLWIFLVDLFIVLIHQRITSGSIFLTLGTTL